MSIDLRVTTSYVIQKLRAEIRAEPGPLTDVRRYLLIGM